MHLQKSRRRIVVIMNKRIIIPVVSTLIISGVLVAVSVSRKTDAEFDLPGLNQQVQRHDEQLGNHEARITNTENDVSDLQDNTSTPSRPDRVDVPNVTTPPAQHVEPAPAPEPQPEPITVVAVNQIPVPNSEDIDCKLTYSDGTEKLWRWKTVTYNQGTKLTSMSGVCDLSVIGRTKND